MIGRLTIEADIEAEESPSDEELDEVAEEIQAVLYRWYEVPSGVEVEVEEL